MPAIDAIEMHDALLKNVRVDHPGKKVTIDFDFYKSSDDRARSPLSITFDAVEYVSHIADLKRMQANAFAGNVNYWSPSSGPGTTYIYTWSMVASPSLLEASCVLRSPDRHSGDTIHNSRISFDLPQSSTMCPGSRSGVIQLQAVSHGSGDRRAVRASGWTSPGKCHVAPHGVLSRDGASVFIVDWSEKGGPAGPP